MIVVHKWRVRVRRWK